jgi:hypothetical protein
MPESVLYFDKPPPVYKLHQDNNYPLKGLMADFNLQKKIMVRNLNPQIRGRVEQELEQMHELLSVNQINPMSAAEHQNHVRNTIQNVIEKHISQY